ncbi:hypothetical protein TL16_g02818 [Triparma laevis f. inornata]|uniref:Aspartyl/asparaginy/proline hydroxylase domain-containing protein n=1 Tax=Triparma laevis f. inornata TaxID=1714386 RepID=A0A9W6ZRY0_9STRA|nr:hypothetical protein TL16_g02818 [Triparma laevis f. inornata]
MILLTSLTLILLLAILIPPTSPSPSPTSSDHDIQTLKHLKQFRTPSGFRQSMPKLIASVRKGPGKRDWVTMQYIAGGYHQMARKLNSAGGLEEEENQTLKLVVATYKMAESVYVDWLSLGEDDYPQLEYVMERTTVLRHWGDALKSLGMEDEAEMVWRKGVEEGLWKREMCRPEREVEVVGEGKWFYELEEVFETKVVERIRSSIEGVREEYVADVEAGRGPETWKKEEAGLHSTKSWSQLPLYVDGDRKTVVCDERYKKTCEVFGPKNFDGAAKGQVKFSVMEGNTYVRPHAGPTMERLRLHCSIVGAVGADSWIRVGNEKRRWDVGGCFVFDESCEHEVSITEVVDGGEYRVVLIADLANVFLKDFDDYREARWEGGGG